LSACLQNLSIDIVPGADGCGRELWAKHEAEPKCSVVDNEGEK